MEIGKFLMLGIITDDIDKSISCFEHLGFHGWEVIHFNSDQIPDVTINRKPGQLAFIGATFRSETINIELLQPLSDGLFMDFLNEHGPGIHHLEFEPGPSYSVFMKEYTDAGHDILMDVDLLGGKAGFAYLNTRELLGFNLEFHKD